MRQFHLPDNIKSSNIEEYVVERMPYANSPFLKQIEWREGMQTARTFTRVLHGDIRQTNSYPKDYHLVWDRRGFLETSVELMLKGNLSENVEFEYDGQGRLAKRTVYSPKAVYPAVKTYSYGENRRTEYEKRYVRLSLFETQRNLFFNDYGKLTSQKEFVNGEISNRTDYFYNENQQIIEKENWDYSKKHGTQKRRSTCEYDELGNLTEYISYDIDDKTILSFEKYHYNKSGLLIQKEVSLTQSVFTYEYDELGRKVKEYKEDPTGALVTQHSYHADGAYSILKEQIYKNTLMHSERISYDERGFLISEVYQKATNDYPDKIEYRYNFDDDGNWYERRCLTTISNQFKTETVTELVLTFHE